MSEYLKQLDLFFHPKSVAIIGASSSRGKIGHEIVRSLVEGGYDGQVYPVTLRTREILGLECYENVSSVPGQVDLAVYSLPSKSAPSIIDECGHKGVKNVVIVSGGFKEVSDSHGDIEAEVVSIARRHGMRIIGPNCIGVLDSYSRFDTFFQPRDRMTRPAPGALSFITQSGTYGVSFLEAANEDNIGVSKMVSYGNKADVDEADLIRYLGQDNRTKVIAVYIEAVGDGRRLVEALREVTPEKPVVAMKAGRTRLGVRTAQSHTGWLAGSYEVSKAALRQAGVIVADNFDELYDCSKALALQPLPRGRRIGMVTNGMGFAVTACDAAEPKGIAVGTYSEETKKKLVHALPSYSLIRDIVDLTGSATSQDYRIAMEALLEDPGIDLLMPSFVFEDSPLDDGILNVLPLMKRFGKPLLCGHCGGAYSRNLVSYLHGESIPFYTSGSRAANVADAMMTISEYRASLPARHKDFFEASPALAVAGRKIIEAALSTGRRTLTLREGESLLKAYGMPTAESALVGNEEEAIEVANHLGFPVVLKIVSSDIIHKSDMGGVLVNLRNESAVREGYRLIMERREIRAPEARVDGILVQKMVAEGVEVIVGATRDREFGPVVMFGLGGVFVEVIRDVTFRLAPISRFEADEMLRETKGYPLLRGVRGKTAADKTALAEILVSVSRLIADHSNILELDLNPIFVRDKGAMIADVRVLLG